MLKKIKIYNFFSIVVIVFLVYFTYRSMQGMGFDIVTESSWSAITKLAIVVMAIVVMIISKNSAQTNFTILWYIWCIWLFILFFVFGLRGNGISNILSVTFCPMSFIFFYVISLYSDKITQIAFIGFLSLYIITLYLIILNLTTIFEVKIGDENSVTNLIYWSLCTLPILLISKKRWITPIVIGITFIIVLLTGKRTATIAIALIILVYIINVMKNRFSIKTILGVIVLFIIFIYLVNTYFQNTYIGVIERLSNISEDEGSGRIPLYIDVFKVMENNTFIDWLLGRGYGSILITKHSNAHNDALQMLFEYGIVGLIVYIIMCFYVIRRMLILRGKKSKYYLGYASSVIITVLLGLTSNLFVFYSYFSFLCAFWGIIEAKMVQSKSVKSLLIRI